MAEAVIFEVNIQDALTKLSNLQAAIELNKQAQQSYQEVVKSGADVSGEAARKLEDLKVANKNLGSEYRSAQRLLEGYTGAQKDNIDTTNFANNSVRQNRLLLKQLTEQYNDARNPTAAFANQIKTLSDTLKKQEGAIGDTRRSVGNYKEGFVDAFKEISSGIPALGGFAKAQQGVNAVLAANPIGGVVTLLFALKDILGGNAIVADTLTFAFDALNKGIGFIVDTVVDTVTNFDKLTAAIKNPIKFIKDFATGAAEAAKEGFNASKALDEFVVSNAKTAAAIQENDLQIQALTKSLKDRTKSEQERIKIANTIADLEIENSRRSRKLAEDELAAESLRLKGRTKSAEDEAKLIDLTSKVRQAAAEENIANSQRQTRINILLDKEEKKALSDSRDKEAQEREKYLANISKLQEEFNLNERQKLEKSFTDKAKQIKGANDAELALIANINTAKERALQKFDQDAAIRREAERKKIADEQKAIQTQAFNDAIQFNQKQAELDQQAVDLSVASEEEKAARKRDIQLRALEEQLALTREFLGADGEITKEELQGLQAIELAIQKVRQTAAQPSERTLGEAIGFSKEQQAEIEQGLQLVLQSLNAVTEVINASYQVRLNEIENTKNAEIAAINKSGATEEQKTKKIQEIEKKAALEAYEIQKKQFETNKALQIVNAIIAGALGVVNAFQLGPIAGAIAAVAIAATTAAQIAVIATQKPPPPPAFADGGKVLSGQMIGANDGKPIQRGNGDNLLATVKTGEVILNQRQQAALGGAATFRKIGVPGFASGGLVGDGGFAARGMTRASEDRSFMTAAIRSGFATAPQPIVTVEEFNKVSTSSQRSVAVSEL